MVYTLFQVIDLILDIYIYILIASVIFPGFMYLI